MQSEHGNWVREHLAMVGAATAVTLALGVGALSASTIRTSGDGIWDEPSKGQGVSVEYQSGDAAAPEAGNSGQAADGARENVIDPGDAGVAQPAEDGVQTIEEVAQGSSGQAGESSSDDAGQGADTKDNKTEDPADDKGKPAQKERPYGWLYYKSGGIGINDPIANCHDIAGSKTGWLPLKDGTYYASKDVRLEGRGSIEGNVTLVLLDGVKIEWVGGLHVTKGHKLTICGQDGGTGKLVADASERDDEAGIGGNKQEANASVTICGGHVIAKGGFGAAGIGGGGEGRSSWFTTSNDGNGGKVEIFDGKVEAYGQRGGAGIGGGKFAGGGEVTIRGGSVTARHDFDTKDLHDKCGAGIGAGYKGNGGSVRILGGDVSATGVNGSSGIGGAAYGSFGNILIENATVTATGSSGAGIGGGYSSTGLGEITIRNSKVTARAKEGAGIGGGWKGSGGKFTIEDNSRIDAQSHKGGAIGRGKDGDSVGTLSLGNRLMVVSCDDGNTKVVTDQRVPHCLYRNHVKIDPCDHEGSHYEQVEGGHRVICDYCKGAAETSEHHFGEDSRCVECGCERPALQFGEPSWQADEGIALKFQVDEPADDNDRRCDDAFLEATVGGKMGRTVKLAASEAKSDEKGHLIFSVELSTIELAQPVKATFHYDGDKTIEQTVTLTDLLASSVERGDKGCNGARTARALANAGYHLQRYLSAENGWRIGADYAEIGLHYDDPTMLEEIERDLEFIRKHASYRSPRVERVAMSVTFGSTTTADFRIWLKPEVDRDAVTADFMCEVPATLESDGSLSFHVEGIEPWRFGTGFMVYDDESGETLLEASVLSYVARVYAKKDVTPEAKAAMAAVCWLGATCDDDLD